jgi:hypothetical protein
MKPACTVAELVLPEHLLYVHLVDSSVHQLYKMVLGG